MQDALDNLRWGADYLMACSPTPGTYIAQIGDPSTDHSYWGRQASQSLQSAQPGTCRRLSAGG